ncbi:NAD(P)H dehydrogenase (quinone) [Arcticibacter tournemirensis]|uniref:SDR family oxidoreductase n=1 Tax=Arcticibacter tournemirensis TaxID=699437 RepID=A0A5M9HEX1_9SPHI|nr:SDR family oxidoreductase [Arcticibacter tournemirensis]KAA8483437.1 SDR family oxidoreductase [Arcticibacter tournemirensis]TQM50868.1 NAD(P)H dehydrogenase (quinone) [Arcticibacter tournemirensis]
MKTAITGATGQLGQLVVNKLKEKGYGESIVALVRSVEKASDLGVEVREANYDKPETLNNALRSVDTLLLISGSEVGKRAVQHKNVIEAAKQNGVQWIIYTSILRADTSTISLAEEHLATETALKNSGIPFTLLRNGWYTENYTGSIQGAIAGGAFIGSAGEGKISSAARADYAEAAVAVLTGEDHQGKTYELAGDEAWTLSDLAAEVSRQTGKNIPYKNLPESDYAAALVSFGLPQELAQAIAGWDVSASQGALFDETQQLSALIGRPTTPLADTVREALQK